MNTYRKTSDNFSFTATHSRTVEEYSGEEPEADPTPSFPPMRVVNTDGTCTDECTVPYEDTLVPVLRKCAAVIPFSKTLRRVS